MFPVIPLLWSEQRFFALLFIFVVLYEEILIRTYTDINSKSKFMSKPRRYNEKKPT